MNSVTYPQQQNNPLTRTAFLNNQLASAYASGAPDYTIKQYDRAGLSRGQGQMAQAGVDAAKNLAQGIADAYTADNQYALSQADRNLQQSVQDEQVGQQATALQEQRRYQNQMAALNRRQQSLDLVQGLLGGLLR